MSLFYKEIENLNLDIIINKILDDYDISYSEAKDMEKLYKSFLHLIKKYPEEKLIPTEEIDIFWHTHILHTEKYMEDCKAIFNKYIHHHPASSDFKKTNDFQTFADKTFQLVYQEFPELVS